MGVNVCLVYSFQWAEIRSDLMREDSPPLLLCVRCRRLVDLCREDLTPPILLLACNNKDGDDG